MSVKIIAENILQDSDFSSATEQASPFWPIPTPAPANAGSFRLQASGEPADFSYSGTATSNGAAGGTTTIDSVLAAYGDDYFIGATLLMTGGTCSGESKTITDFAQATGTLTHAAFTAQIDLGDTFTLTMPYSTRSFIVTEVASGDAGAATFKWSHNGGTTYLGRTNPYSTNWLASATIYNDIDGATPVPIIQAANGDMIAIYQDNSTQRLYCKISINNGITWGSAIAIDTQTVPYPLCALLLQSGRIILSACHATYYWIWVSDDNGASWSHLSANLTTPIRGMVEISTNIIYGVYMSSNAIYGIISSDGGITWGTAITIANDANDQDNPTICRTKNQTLICAYNSNQDAIGDYEIKCKISTDNGITWGSAIAVLSVAGGASDITKPQLLTDIDGSTIYCMATKADADTKIVLSASTDSGVTWGAEGQLVTAVGNDYDYPSVALLTNGSVWCAFVNVTNNDLMFVRQGLWAAYSSNACPCAVQNVPQHLACDAQITWNGGAGIANDTWTFGADYQFSMKNLITDSPSKPWRSTQDNIACTILIDMGANERYYSDGVAFFGCNLRTLSFQMNATDSWGSPSVNQSVSFDIVTGTVDAVSGNYIQDTSVMASYKDHQLKDNYIRMTSGTDNGLTWKILDNVDDYIILDTTAATNIAQNDTFAIFQPQIALTFNEGLYRYIRLSIAAQQTAENYYQIGTMVAGRATTLTDPWAVEYGKSRRYNIEMLNSPSGGLIPIRQGDPQYAFDLTIPGTTATNTELIAIADLLSGRNLALIPDSTTLTDVYLCKFDGEISQQNLFLNTFSVRFRLIEVK